MMNGGSESTRLVGRGIPKPDAVPKACGAARYAADIRPPTRGLLCAKILRSPHPHAEIVAIDTTRAESLKGVCAVATGKEVTHLRIGRYLRDRHALARDKVRHIGEPVAAVAAVDEETAEAALSLIEVEYRPLPAVFSPAEASAPGAPIVHEDLASYEDPEHGKLTGNQRNHTVLELGDVEAAFAEADVVVEGTFSTQAVHQGYVEPRACVADVDKNGKVTVWSSTRTPFLARDMIGRSLGLPLSKIRVITPTLGGHFGGKVAPAIEPICALLALKAHRPVKLALNTQDELAWAFGRHPGRVRLRAAARRDGTLVGVEGEVVYNCGGYCDGAGGVANTCSHLQGAYYVPNVRLQGRSIFTNSIPAGHVRGPGGPQTVFPIESLMDELARRLNLDPLEFRRQNRFKQGDPGPGGKLTMGNVGLGETIDEVARHISEHIKRGPNQGIGVACCAWKEMATPTSEALSKSILKLNEDGSAILLTGLPDDGSGQHVILTQIVGEVLGLEPGEVTIVAGDTDLVPYDRGPGASRGISRVGNATKLAAEDVRRQLVDLAASRLEANPADLEFGGGRIYVKGTPDKGVSLEALARSAINSPAGAVIGTGTVEREQWYALAQEHAKVADEAHYCTHAALVEVDPETGQVSVLQYVVAQDVGKALNYLNSICQIHGQVVAGLGTALSEELVVLEGSVANRNLSDYRMPLADTAPPIHSILIERPSLLGPYGAKGVGEISVAPVPAVIANAVYDAVGVRMRDLPITSEKILRALQEKGEAR